MVLNDLKLSNSVPEYEYDDDDMKHNDDKKRLKIIYRNIGGLRSRSNILMDDYVLHDPDIILLTEPTTNYNITDKDQVDNYFNFGPYVWKAEPYLFTASLIKKNIQTIPVQRVYVYDKVNKKNNIFTQWDAIKLNGNKILVIGTFYLSPNGICDITKWFEEYDAVKKSIQLKKKRHRYKVVIYWGCECMS